MSKSNLTNLLIASLTVKYSVPLNSILMRFVHGEEGEEREKDIHITPYDNIVRAKFNAILINTCV